MASPGRAPPGRERPQLAGWGDEGRTAALLAWTDASPARRPSPASIYLGSHGPLYRVQQRHWSKEQRMDESFIREFSGDAIRDFDRD